MQCPQCGTVLNPAEFRTGADGSPLCPFCGASVRGQADLLPPETAWRVPQSSASDVPGLISIVCGGISLLCIPLGCFTCGITCVVAMPLILVGILCGFWATGTYRITGLLMNFIAFVPSAVICGFFAVAFLKQDHRDFFDPKSWPENPVNQAPAVALPKYQPLYHETSPGCAFHFAWGDRRFIACSMQQFKGQPPSELRSREFPGKISIQQQVHKQEDLQVLNYRSDELDKITPLSYDDKQVINEGDEVVLQIKDRALTGMIAGKSPLNAKYWQFELPEAVTAADCVGAPVISESTDKVIGVVVANPGPGQSPTLTFEPLNLPRRLR